MPQMRFDEAGIKFDVYHRRAKILHGRDRLLGERIDLRIALEEIAKHAELPAPEGVPIERLGEIHAVFRGSIDLLDLAPRLDALRIVRIREGENIHHERDVRHVPGHRAGAVKIQIFRGNARARYQPGRRAQADDARKGCA